MSPTTIHTVSRGCLKKRPPTIPDAGELILAPGEGICPKAATGGCLMVEAAVAIGEQLRYSREAWIKCRPNAGEDSVP